MKNIQKVDELIIRARKIKESVKYDFSRLTTSELKELIEDESISEEREKELIEKIGVLYE